MSKQISEGLVQHAITAAYRYIGVKKECRDRHEAFIGVSVNGKTQHGVRTVFVGVTDESVEIIIENLHTLCSHHTNRFTADTDDISIIDKTLQVRPRSSICGKVVIEITAK